MITDNNQQLGPDQTDLIIIRPSHLLIAILALVPIALALTYGPVQTVHGDILARGLPEPVPESWLMGFINQMAPIGPRLLILTQSLLMGLVVIAIATTSYLLSQQAGIALRSAFMLVGLVEWVRWSPCVSPDPIVNSLGVLGLLGWIDLRRHPAQFKEERVPVLLLITLWAAVAILSGFWLLVAIPALIDIGAGYIGARLGANRAVIITMVVVLSGLINTSVFMQWSVQRQVEQSREGRLLSGQIISGYPDFRIPDSSVASVRNDHGIISRELGFSIKVALLRIVTELGQIRPFFSFRHNLWIVVVCLPILAVGLWGMCRSAFCAGMLPVWIFLLNWLLFVGWSGADWEGRLMAVIWPMVVLMANQELKRIHLSRFFARASGFLVLTMILIWLVHRPVLEGLGRWLVVDNREPSDVMVVLVGGEPDRDRLAVSLYRQGYAREIWVANENDLLESDLYNDAGKLIRRMVDAGVPRDRITLLPSAWNTMDEASRVAGNISRMPPEARPQSVTVITTTFHTRRAYHLFKKMITPLGTELRMAASVDPTLVSDRWWLDNRTRYLYLQETAMFVFTWLLFL